MDNNSLTSVISKYIDRGFGSMTKNDFEVWIFGTLLQMPKYKGKSNYELSVLLRIPETKVKRLRYESALKNVKPNTDYKDEVYKLLDKAQLRVSDRKIVFQVEDVMIKSYISSILKQNGRMLDSSFNPELIVLHLDDFQYLAKEVYPGRCLEDFLDKINKQFRKFTKKEITWYDVMGWVFEGAISGVSSGITSTVTTNLTPLGIIGTIERVLKLTLNN